VTLPRGKAGVTLNDYQLWMRFYRSSWTP